MRKLSLSLVVFIIFAGGCIDVPEISPEERQREIEQSKNAAQAYVDAVRLAESNDPAGFLKLYEIAEDDITYTVEYSQGAEEKIFLLLYSKTELWINTFSKMDLDKFKSFVKGIEVSEFPEGVASIEQFKQEIFNNLRKIKGDENEMALVHHILGLYKQEY